MSDLFLTILNFSINASWLILVVLVLRLLMKKAPKWISCVLWALVAVRLVCPFSLKSVLSLLPSSEVIPRNITMAQKPAINTGISFINNTVNPVISESLAPQIGDSVNPLQIITAVAAVIWITGMIILIIYALISYIRLKRKVRASIPAGKNIMACDDIKTPFILGLFRPVIYVPSSVKGKSLELVIAHENAHLRRHDHWWKPLGFVLLTVYWFNPLCWIAYILLCRDIEAACDEKVIREKDKEYIADYSQTLLDLSVPGKIVSACPLAFGETGVKGRVKGVLNYRKPAFWLIIAAMVSCCLVGMCFLTDPVSAAVNDDLAQFLEETVLEQNRSSQSDNYFCCCDIELIDVRTRGKKTDVYAMVLYYEYSNDGGVLNVESGSHGPAVIKVKKTDTGYELEEYWTPRDGTYYENDIRTKIPWTLRSKMLDTQTYIGAQETRCREKAEEYFADGRVKGEVSAADGEQYNIDWLNINDTKVFYYSGNIIEGRTWINFSITLNPDGTFSYYETPISSFIGMGKYQIKDGILTLANDKEFTGREDVFRFRIEGDRFYYIAEGSSNFDFVKLDDGEEFVLGVNPLGNWWEETAEQDDPQIYYYSGNVAEGKNIIEFSITLYKDGTFEWYETPFSSFIGMGKYDITDDILTLANDKEFTGNSDVNRFRIEGDKLYFIKEGSSNFPYVKLEDGAEFVLGVNPIEGWLDEFDEQSGDS